MKTIRCDFDKALIASARSARACLLRHLDTVRVPSRWETPLWWPAPPTDVLNRARLQPDIEPWQQPNEPFAVMDS